MTIKSKLTTVRSTMKTREIKNSIETKLVKLKTKLVKLKTVLLLKLKV